MRDRGTAAPVWGGIDIGGTKCAVVLGRVDGDRLVTLARRQWPTPPSPALACAELIDRLDALVRGTGVVLSAVGISCGGPLDSDRGLILSPPNLPGWDQVDLVTPLRDRYHVPVRLENDANLGAVAEWWWGAGRGVRHLVFLTCGTGMGAGLILNGALYRGVSGSAGEVGHVRLTADGPTGFGKAGSWEGWASGAGIGRLAARMRQSFGHPTLLTLPDAEITAEVVGAAADRGDALALAVLEAAGERLGAGLAILLDVLNPELVVLGGVYGRQRHRLEPPMRAALHAEALPAVVGACRIEAAHLGEAIGDAEALAAAALAVHAS